MLPGTIEGMKHVCYFRHALALDERRIKFLPEYAYGGSATPPAKPEDEKPFPGNRKSPPNDRTPIAVHDRPQVRIKTTENRPHTIEVWFAGTHSDM